MLLPGWRADGRHSSYKVAQGFPLTNAVTTILCFVATRSAETSQTFAKRPSFRSLAADFPVAKLRLAALMMITVIEILMSIIIIIKSFFRKIGASSASDEGRGCSKPG